MRLKPSLSNLLILFVVSVVIITVIRSAQGLDAFSNGAVILFGGILGVVLLYNMLIRKTLIGFLIALSIAIWTPIFLDVFFIQQIKAYGLMTGLGFISTLTGPLGTLGYIIPIALLGTAPGRRGLMLAIPAFVVGLVLTGILRGFQHLDPQWEPWTVVLIGIFFALGGFMTGAFNFDPRRMFEGQPSLPRAISMGILGFLLGGLIVVVGRGLQSLTPIWEPGIGIVMISFTTAAFFVWGIGAFDPKMSVHGEGHAEEHAEKHAEPEAEKSVFILGTQIWQVAFLVIGVLAILIIFATLPGGPYLPQTSDPLASPAKIGSMQLQLPFGGPQIEISELVVFFGFVIFTLVSLAAAAGLLAFVFYFLSRNVAEVKATAPTPEEQTPPEQIQALGSIAGGVAGWLRAGLPKLLGQK